MMVRTQDLNCDKQKKNLTSYSYNANFCHISRFDDFNNHSVINTKFFYLVLLLSQTETLTPADWQTDLGFGGSRAALLDGKNNGKNRFPWALGMTGRLPSMSLNFISILYRGQRRVHGPKWTANI